jgi:[protein-PII] uridylyltransferase
MNRLLDNDRRLRESPLRGSAWCRAYTAKVDEWLAMLFADAAAGRTDLALVATGGHGRRELCPFSDLDLMLVHVGGDVDAVASALWYPMWDSGVKLGHAVRTIDQALELAADDLEVATALLTSRAIAGDENLAVRLRDAAISSWRQRADVLVEKLRDGVLARADQHGEVAFLLEPDLKESRGGLRDVHALEWLDVATPVLAPSERTALDDAQETLLAARVALHLRTDRRSDVLLLQEQDGVAVAIGYRDGDELMAEIAAAARSVAWMSDSVWHRIERPERRRLPRLKAGPKEIAPGVLLQRGLVSLAPAAAFTDDPLAVLRVAVAAAQHEAFLTRDALERLAAECPPMPTPWPAEARRLLTDLLLTGRPAIEVIESLDQLGLWHRLIPEWAPARSRPQRNAYHRFTVDRHLCEAAAEAAALASRVSRPDLLVLGALLHDIGKGYAGDHTEVGIELVDRVASRMGFPDADVAVLVSLVRHHLLLPDAATRRDLDDASTIRGVANRVGSVETLELLAALSEADSIATGPAAWGSWKAGLMRVLVERTAHVLRGGEMGDLREASAPTLEQRRLLEGTGVVVEHSGGMVVVAAPDRPGLFSRVAGALSLSGLDVVEASAYSEGGRALSTYRVVPVFDREPDWNQVCLQLDRAIHGRLALRSRLAERARTYARRRPSSARPVEPKVLIDNGASDVATVVEIDAPDAIGVLYRITSALAECDLDIVTAKVQTLGPVVVDAFYVRDRHGAKVEDPAYLSEIERAVLHALAVEW